MNDSGRNPVDAAQSKRSRMGDPEKRKALFKHWRKCEECTAVGYRRDRLCVDGSFIYWDWLNTP